MKKTRWLLAFLFFAPGAPRPAAAREMAPTESTGGLELGKEAEDWNSHSLKDESGITWQFMPSVYAGYNQLLKGYPGYKNLGNVGAELWIYPIESSMDEPHWYTNNFLVRISVDWMPLQVPEANYGLVEDLYAATGQIVYKFDGERDGGGWIPFLGFGGGSYLDRLTLNTPATGKVTGTHSFLGVNASAGIFLPAMGPFRLVAEARYHRIHGPDSFWPQNVTYQGGLVYGFRSKAQ